MSAREKPHLTAVKPAAGKADSASLVTIGMGG